MALWYNVINNPCFKQEWGFVQICEEKEVVIKKKKQKRTKGELYFL